MVKALLQVIKTYYVITLTVVPLPTTATSEQQMMEKAAKRRKAFGADSLASSLAVRVVDSFSIRAPFIIDTTIVRTPPVEP